MAVLFRFSSPKCPASTISLGRAAKDRLGIDPANSATLGDLVYNNVFVADFNRDGVPDIADNIATVLGNGDGTFQPPQYFLTGSSVGALVAVADLNGDGLPDEVFVNYAQDPTGIPGQLIATSLSVLLNNTPGPANSVIGHSAATGIGPVAPSSIASVFGKNFAGVTASASGTSLPTTLGSISLQTLDDTGTMRLAPLIYVSPTQINFVVPDQVAPGPVVLTVDDGTRPLVETANATAVTAVAPTIFTANGQGTGAAAALAVRILANGSQQAVPVFNCAAPGQCGTVPIDLLGGQPVYLSLYGTGFRGAPAPAPSQPIATCQVGGVGATVQFAGAHATIPGLDQINILLPASLGSGTAPVQCQFVNAAGLPLTNPVQITIK